MFTPARIVVLDDKPEHLVAIEKTIRGLGSSCVCLTYEPRVDPPALPFSRARVIFMDLQLMNDQFNTDFKNHYAEIQRILTRVISPEAGPYLLVIWTAKPERVAELEEYLKKNLFSKLPHTRPVKLLRMSKDEFINLSTGETKDPEAMRAYVTEQLESVPALAALLEWENEIIAASDRVVADVLRLASTAQVDDQPDIGVALRRLATAAVGAPNVGKDPRAAIHSALFPLLEDHVQYEVVMPSTEQPTPPSEESPRDGDTTGPENPEPEQLEVTASEPGGPDDSEKGLEPETVVAADIPTDAPAPDPGTTDAEAEEGGDQIAPQTASPIESALTEKDTTAFAKESIWDAALAGTEKLTDLTRAQAASLNSHVHLGGASSRLTPIMWGAICKLEGTIDWTKELGLTSEQEYREHILKCLNPHRGNALPGAEQLRLMQIRIGASCDYAQKTDGPIPYVIAAFVPLTARISGAKPLELHRLQSDSTAWLSPVLNFPGHGAGQFVADPRFVRSRGEDAAAAFIPVNRLREQLLMQLIGTVARHGDRPGIIYFEGTDTATA